MDTLLLLAKPRTSVPSAQEDLPRLTDAAADEKFFTLFSKALASFGLGPEGIAELRARFAAWPRS